MSREAAREAFAAQVFDEGPGGLGVARRDLLHLICVAAERGRLNEGERTRVLGRPWAAVADGRCRVRDVAGCDLARRAMHAYAKIRDTLAALDARQRAAVLRGLELRPEEEPCAACEGT